MNVTKDHTYEHATFLQTATGDKLDTGPRATL